MGAPKLPVPRRRSARSIADELGGQRMAISLWRQKFFQNAAMGSGRPLSQVDREGVGPKIDTFRNRDSGDLR